jgi:hypothetical protein
MPGAEESGKSMLDEGATKMDELNEVTWDEEDSPRDEEDSGLRSTLAH